MLLQIVPFCSAQFNVTYCLYFCTFVIEQTNDDDDGDDMSQNYHIQQAFCSKQMLMVR